MPRRDDGSCQRRLGTFLVLVLLMTADEARGSDPNEASDEIVVARAEILPASIVRAVLEAAVRLRSPACQQVFSDFHDEKGITLQLKLDALGVSGSRYLGWTLFYDGSGKPICERRDILAATAPGSRAIFVCTSQFSLIAQKQPGLAAALVIHEELHSLGLGENPPDSKAITAQVLARCGK